MAVNNWTDYSKAPVQQSPWENMLENVLQGYKISQEPKKMAEEQQQRELANRLKSMEVEHRPKEYEQGDKAKDLANSMQEIALKYADKKNLADLDYKQSLVNKNNRPAAIGSNLKPNGDVANELVIENLKVSNPELAQKLEKVFKAGQDQKQSRSDNASKYAESIAWSKLPAAEKERSIAYAAGMDFDPLEAGDAFSKGKTLKDLAADKGFTLSEVQPSYALTGGEIKDNRKRNAFNSEMKNVDKKITDWMAPYATKTYGYSFDQVLDSIKELKSPDPKEQKKLGKFLAARALAPELAGLRMNSMGGKVGIESIKHLTDVSLGKAEIIESLLDKPTFLEFQKYLNEAITDANSSFNNYMDKSSGFSSNNKSNNSSGSAKNTERVFNLATGQWESE